MNTVLSGQEYLYISACLCINVERGLTSQAVLPPHKLNITLNRDISPTLPSYCQHKLCKQTVKSAVLEQLLGIL